MVELNNGGESFDHSEDTSYRLLSNGEKHKKGFNLEKKTFLFYYVLYDFNFGFAPQIFWKIQGMVILRCIYQWMH